MKALVLHDSSENRINIDDVPMPVLGRGEALIRIRAAALNHRDEWIRRGQYAKIRFGAILGSDGCGTVEEVASDEHRSWVGKEVIINPSLDWGANPRVQNRSYHILGMPRNGTFAEYCAVPVDNLVPKPDYLSAAEASAFCLAGVTAYRAVTTYGMVGAGQKVLVTGIGGGVAQFAAQFALALGAEVYCTSGSAEKLHKARAMGILGGANYTQEGWHMRLQQEVGEFDLVIDSAAGNGMDTLLSMLAFGGRYVFYGATAGRPTTLNVQMIFWRQLCIQGSTMGNSEEFAAMIRFAEAKKIVPIIDSVRSFTDIVRAFDMMARGEQFGKLVVTMP